MRGVDGAEARLGWELRRDKGASGFQVFDLIFQISRISNGQEDGSLRLQYGRRARGEKRTVQALVIPVGRLGDA